MNSIRRWDRCIIFGSAAALLGQAGAATAQAYPTKPVRVIVAFAAGGFADYMGRQMGQKLSDRLGQSFVIDNRGGAGGTYGAKLAADGAPDGYTLLVNTAASTVAPSLYMNLGYDLLKDFTPVANTVSAAGLFAVLASHPSRDLKDLIQRSKGRQLNYATAGVGHPLISGPITFCGCWQSSTRCTSRSRAAGLRPSRCWATRSRCSTARWPGYRTSRPAG